LARSDANEQSFRCRPRAFDGALAQVFDHLAVHALRREPQREFTQSGEIAFDAGDGVQRRRCLSPPKKFASANERSGNDEAEKNPHSRAEIALFD